MILNGEAIRAAATGFQAIFLSGLAKATPLYTLIASTKKSSGSKEEYHIPGGVPAMREWLGDRQVANLKRFTQSIPNKHYELTISVPRDLFEDDELGLIDDEFMAMGLSAANHPDTLLVSLLENGFSANGYDEVPFFSASHPLKSGTQSNLSTQALDEDSFEAAIAKLRKMKNWHGEPMDLWSIGSKPILIVPPDLEVAAQEIVAMKTRADGSENPNYGKAEIRVFNRLTSTTKWYLAMGNGPLAPFIYQTRKKAEVVPRDQPGDECVWTRNEVEYGVDGRWAMGYALYFLIVGSTGVD